ncbi:MAG: metallophosphoesterase [Methylobacter sp.]|nr:MAG: metallophosphoesterase [Methylobacter sp.]PPD03753.1 MAG: metallophosphoesterase [Methylobacter sp.]PPD23299.1 MAG: metallophosphoesterase [Methylobacter sp.]
MDTAKKILFAGDPHGDFKPLIKAVYNQKPAAVVLLGDCDLVSPLEHCLQEILNLTEIYWIAGNHDFESPEKYRYLFHSGLAQNNLHLTVKNIGGLRIAGLGGIFLGRVWYPPQMPKWPSKQAFLASGRGFSQDSVLSLKYQSAIWPDEFEFLKGMEADILVSHEAPGSHCFGFKAIGELAAAMKVKTIFHGHLHEDYACIMPNQVRVFGVANGGVRDLAGECCL